jgi:hypothetical protein
VIWKARRGLPAALFQNITNAAVFAFVGILPSGLQNRKAQFSCANQRVAWRMGLA